MRILIAFILLVAWCAHATTFTEFYCDTSNGSTNINAGSTTNATPVYSSVNGNWDGTSVYTPTDGSTPASTVSAGMWGAIFIDGSTNLVQTSAGGCVMLITNVAAGANGAITFDRSAFMGTAPSSSATGRSINVGGCWNGPYRTIGFPFGFVAFTATNSNAQIPRVNFRNTSQYNVTAAMTHGNIGPIRFQGMTTSPGDLGKATIDGGTSVSGYIVLAVSVNLCDFSDLIFANNGNSAANMLNISGNFGTWERVVVHDAQRSGFAGAGANTYIECEAYACDKLGTAAHGGFFISGSGSSFIRCIAHDNTLHGFYAHVYATFLNCISESNTGDGMFIDVAQMPTVIGCDFYNNTLSGIRVVVGTGSLAIQNCNFFKNGAWGITNSVSVRSGFIENCSFGSGTQANASGDKSNMSGINEIGSITYTANQTPWEDPANGDFRLSSGATLVKAAGRGAFTQTAASYTGTVSYPDIGAAQSASTNSATASGGAYTWAQ